MPVSLTTIDVIEGRLCVELFVTAKFVKVCKEVALVPVSILETVKTSSDKIVRERLFHIGPCVLEHPDAQP